MPNSKETFNVGDNCIILINEVPTSSVITRKVQNDELSSDGKSVISSVHYYVMHQGNSQQWLGKIFKSKDAMLSDFATSLK
jgi:hypothetical protein